MPFFFLPSFSLSSSISSCPGHDGVHPSRPAAPPRQTAREEVFRRELKERSRSGARLQATVAAIPAPQAPPTLVTCAASPSCSHPTSVTSRSCLVRRCFDPNHLLLSRHVLCGAAWIRTAMAILHDQARRKGGRRERPRSSKR